MPALRVHLLITGSFFMLAFTSVQAGVVTHSAAQLQLAIHILGELRNTCLSLGSGDLTAREQLQETSVRFAVAYLAAWCNST